MSEIRNATSATRKMIFAMPAAAEAIPPNPNRAATSATIRNIKAQENIESSVKVSFGFLSEYLQSACHHAIAAVHGQIVGSVAYETWQVDT